MKIGKVPNDILEKVILNKINVRRDEVLVRPKVGEDCAIIDFGEDVCILSSDPITGAENEVGSLAVHVSCNDIASSGVEPIGLLVAILAPENATIDDLDRVMEQICDAAKDLNVEIIGGHTEVTSAVNKFVIVTTAIGKNKKDKIILSSGAKVGDEIIMTKYAGIEGTAILANDKQDYLETKLPNIIIENAKKFSKEISVVKDGKIAGKHKVNSMHDVTEGGIEGALWELADASNVGIEVYENLIPVKEETNKICEIFNINPLRLISSGCMVMTTNNAKELLAEYEKNNVKATVIGRVIKDTKRFMVNGENKREIKIPDVDELYKGI